MGLPLLSHSPARPSGGSRQELRAPARSSSLASTWPSGGYTPSVFPTADARGQRLPVCRLSELGAPTRLCLHRPVANRQLWVAVVISAEHPPLPKDISLANLFPGTHPQHLSWGLPMRSPDRPGPYEKRGAVPVSALKFRGRGGAGTGGCAACSHSVHSIHWALWG